MKLINSSNNSLKNKIIENFSKASSTYDNYSIVQQKVAKNLFNIVVNNNLIFSDNSIILELGTGTGEFSKYIFKLHSNTNTIIFSDISKEMLKKFREKYNWNINIIAIDGEEPSFKDNSIDIIYSASTFQWFLNWDKALKNIYNILKPNGYLIFSMFGENTFYTLKKFMYEINPQYKITKTIIDYKSLIQKLKETNFNIIYSDKELIYQSFNSLRDFFKYQKSLGTININKNSYSFTLKDFYQLNKKYMNKYNEILIDYEVYYFIVKKSLV